MSTHSRWLRLMAVLLGLTLFAAACGDDDDDDGGTDGENATGGTCTHSEDGPLSLRISTTGGDQLRENTQLVLQDQLSDAGIELTIDNVEGLAVFAKFYPESNLLTDQDYDIALFAWTGTPFPSDSKALYSNDDPTMIGSNNTGYQNDDVVKLFDEALAETDFDVAADLYNQIDEILWEDLPTIPLYQKPTFFPYRNTINEVEDNASTAGPLWNADEWTIEGEDGGTVVFANDQEPDGWNVNTASSNSLALRQLTELVLPATFRITPEFEAVMDEDLLDSAEMVSEDPQVIEYVISPEAVWSDGTPITADDFEYQWTMMNGSNPDADTATTTGYDRIESVEGSGDGKTVTATFAEPFSEWQSLFANILPAHLMTELGGGDPLAGWNDGLDGENAPQFSGGPFLFEDYLPEQSVTLVPNEAYWGTQPELDEIVIRFDVDDAGIPAALENDEIDMAYPSPQLDLVEEIEGISDVESLVSFGLSFEHIDFNLANSHLAKQEVREAIALALDREDLVARTVGQFSDEASVLGNRIWLTSQQHYEAHDDEYRGQDIEEAQARLESAGYTCGG